MVHFWKDREGKKLSLKEFITRWKQGVEGVTPLQLARTNYTGSWIVSVGILFGLAVTITHDTFWWISIILCGALFNSTASLISSWQKYNTLKNLEAHFEEGERRLENE